MISVEASKDPVQYTFISKIHFLRAIFNLFHLKEDEKEELVHGSD
jgi:hypothetical protein